ncbi:MAG: 16S rRNA (cytosine(1402)-N(4))-methyltransferase RsmH [Deltaproteobacteria bacterium]|nr:16S rRNA (cytosine(1402)-N(4))-methyltransferase RsmH [Deltaproteobacteria bacterium]
MAFAHTTVLRDPTAAAVAAGVRAALAVDRRGSPAGAVADCTLGGGGHSEALLLALHDLPEVSVVGLDRDPQALAAATVRLAGFGSRFRAVHGRFGDLPGLLPGALLGVVADLGVSSPQFDDADRGFSFRADGPLDMRMDPTRGPTAADLLDSVRLEDLADVLFQYGDIRRSIGTARIVLDEYSKGANTTARLAERLAARLDRSRSLHPATQVFQALRIWVNDEAAELERLLDDVPDRLAPGAALAVITFHSGEDRAVKHAFAQRARTDAFEVRERRGVVADGAEVAANVRARSARLRVLWRRTEFDLTRRSANIDDGENE